MRPQLSDERYIYRFEDADEDLACEPAFTQLSSDAEPFPFLEPIISTPDRRSGKVGFVRRQFSLDVTPRQNKFDWAVGVFLPLICFYFDPLVFRSTWDQPMLGKYRIFAYTLAFLSIMSMAAWLLWRERLGWLNGWLAGIFLTGSVISLIVGINLVPISLLGLLVLIGALGFTPLFASIVYFRNAFRAVAAAGPAMDSRTLSYVVLLSSLISLVIPFIINGLVSR